MLKSKRAMTLMEMLLVLAVIAVAAAISTPTFFMNARQKVVQARLTMFKARYFAIRSAINMQLKDAAVLDDSYKVNGAASTVSRIERLRESGHLQPAALRFENNAGTEKNFSVEIDSSFSADMPPVLQSSELCVFVAGTTYNIDKALKQENKTWLQIWEDVNNL